MNGSLYQTEYSRRKREMDSPLWESQRKAYLQSYFYLWPEIEKMKEDESIVFHSWEEKETYPDHSPRMTPDLEAMMDFLCFLASKEIHHHFVYNPLYWEVQISYI